MQQSLERLGLEAVANLFRLSENSYPGCGFVVGLDESEENLIQMSWLMGRHEESKNRIFVPDGGRLFIAVADPLKKKGSDSILYNAMCEVRPDNVTYAVVGDGDHTGLIADGYAEDQGLELSMHWKGYEQDAPNYTSRITAVCYWLGGHQPTIRMALVRKSPWSGLCDRNLYEISGVGPGFGYCMTSYARDGSPLPPFRGEPYLLPLCGSAEQMLVEYWEILNADHRVALAVKTIPRQGASRIIIVNQHQNI